MMTTVKLIGIISVSIVLISCQSAKELHYFKTGGNYYRLMIDEKSFASKARYLSGYFDEKAVDKYFSEMSQPDSGKFVEWVSSQGRGSQLVMILSTNSTSVAEQIGQLASNEELLENIALLANKDKITQSKTTAYELSEIRKMNEDVLKAGDAYLDTATTTTIRQNVRDFLDNLRINTGGKLVLPSLGTAISKFN